MPTLSPEVPPEWAQDLHTYYLNQQLQAFHATAQYWNARTKEAKLKSGADHIYALAECILKLENGAVESFNVKFDKSPTLDFICSHDAILRIYPKEESFYVQDDGSIYHFPEGMWLSYRVTFTPHWTAPAEVESSLNTHNDGSLSSTDFIILDINPDIFYPTRASSDSPGVITDVDKSLRGHLLKHFDLLCEAKDNILFSVHHRGPPNIMEAYQDYVLQNSAVEGSYKSLSKIYDVKAEDIQRRISSAWQKSSIMMVTQGDGTPTTIDDDWRARSLAQFSTTSWNNFQFGRFNMTLSEPTVEILCMREVIVCFGIDQLDFLEDDNSKVLSSVQGWKIAVIVNVKYEKYEHDRASNFRFDFSSNGRYLDSKSKYPEYKKEDFRRRQLLTDFFSKAYLRILLDSHYDFMPPGTGRRESLPRPPTQEDIDRGRMGKYHIGFVVSQGSIKHPLQGTEAKGWQWVCPSGCLEATFASESMEFSFLPGNYAIILVHLRSVSIPGKTPVAATDPPKESDETGASVSTATPRKDFSGWHLAFKVGIRKRTVEDSEGIPPPPGSRKGEWDLIEIYFDFENPEYIHGQSNFDDLIKPPGSQHERNTSLPKDIETIKDCIAKHYLREVIRDARHFICQVPVLTAKREGVLSSSTTLVPTLTDFDFATVSPGSGIDAEAAQDTPDAHASPGRGESKLVMCGMTGFQPMPAIIGNPPDIPAGTLGISNHIFVNGNLLAILSRINESTTLIPTISNDSSCNGALDDIPRAFSVEAWAKHKTSKSPPCSFTLLVDNAQSSRNIQTYEWKLFDERQLRRVRDGRDVTYEFSCDTQTHLKLPSTIQGEFDIILEGKVKLSLTIKNPSPTTEQVSLDWSIRITRRPSRMRAGPKLDISTSIGEIEVQPPVPRRYEEDMRSTMATKLSQILRHHFHKESVDRLVDLKALAEELDQLDHPVSSIRTPAGLCSLVNPKLSTFNGDMFFDLHLPGLPSWR